MNAMNGDVTNVDAAGADVEISRNAASSFGRNIQDVSDSVQH